MKPFITDDFLLETQTAQALYTHNARDLPIFDYHCHLSPQQIAEDHRFESITDLWLAGDHYKWRALRTSGIDEKFITGTVPDWERFNAWACTVPHTLRNPLYHWTHLELKRFFGIDELLNSRSARRIYDQCNEMLQTDEFSAQALLRKMKVAVVCTTDDPADTLEHHRMHAGTGTRLYPAWRPDNALRIDALLPFNEWLDRLSGVCNTDIARLSDLLEALQQRHRFFHEEGCRISDHGIDRVYAENFTERRAARAFKRARAGKPVDTDDSAIFKSFMLHFFGIMDHARGWVQQYHIGALRNANSRAYRKLGPDTGFDSIGDGDLAGPLATFLDRLDRTDQLAKTILYPIHPADNEVIATMIGNFQDGRTPGKMQFGSAWWFLDQKQGIEQQLNALSNMGLLSRFIGMTTDSRSFLSYSRHEYFRRILCNLLGNDMERGLLPDDRDLIGEMIADICYGNAKRYFGLATGTAEK